MDKWYNSDKLWNWAGFQVIKWITGFFILGFVLLQIINLSMIEDYDKKVISDTVKVSKIVVYNTVLFFKSLDVKPVFPKPSPRN